MQKSPNTLTIASLSTPKTISAVALEACASAAKLFVQTELTPCVKPLIDRGVSFLSMDKLYEESDDFDALTTAVTNCLVAALNLSDVVYAVPGDGVYAGSVVERIRSLGFEVKLIPGVPYAFSAAGDAGFLFDTSVIVPANSLPKHLDISAALFVQELDTQIRAGEVKLALSEYYPDEHYVSLCRMSDNGAYTAETIQLYDLDRQKGFHATTVLIVPPVSEGEFTRHGFDGYGGLVELMSVLREKCPWDKKQTHDTLKKNLIEECYEVIDAIDRGDDADLAEELGDVLLQCVFHARIAQDQGRFTIRDVTTGIVEKLIYRHPHIFGNVLADTSEQVLKNWEELKKAEKHLKNQSQVLAHVPPNLPALMRAYKVQKKARDVGFDWEYAAEAIEKLKEEVAELESAICGEGEVAEEMGDLLFASVNVARLLELEPEEALRNATEKFITRFSKMETLANEKNLLLKELPLYEKNTLWDFVKRAE